MEKVYLGDAVYAAFDGYAIALTTEDGIDVTNEIVLEPEVLRALDNYRRRIAEAAQEKDGPK